MYRTTSSPIFDVPEIPTLRRVKPLPKRRRTTGAADLVHQEDTMSLSSPALVAQSAQALLQQSAAVALLHQHQQQQQPLDVVGPNATAEELLAHADTLSARMALQSYYMPILGGVQSLLAGATAIGNAGDRNNANNTVNNNSNTAVAAAAAALAAVAGAGAGAGRNGQSHMPPGPLSDLDSLEFGVHFAAAAAAAAAAGVAMGGLGGLGMSLGMNMNAAMGMGGMSVNAGNMGMGMGMGIGGGRDDARRDPDYIDNLQQHGNTKKRKVPANAGGSPRGGHGGDGGRPGSPSSLFPEDEPTGGSVSSTALAEFQRDRERDRDRDRDRDREDYDSSTPPVLYPPPPFPGQLSIVIQKRGKLTAATLAGLQHKEMLKSRKRQLAAVMGALSHGDTLALDQALSASYPLIGGLTGSMGVAGGGGGGGEGGGEALRVHKSKRKSVRLARVMRLTRVPRHPDAAPFPTSDFGFICPSASESFPFLYIYFFFWIWMVFY